MDYGVDRNWAEAVHVEMNSARQLSVHRTQLEKADSVIINLAVENPRGHVLKIENTSPMLRLILSGGTDDPAVELHLRLESGSSDSRHAKLPPANTIVYKFPAFEHSTHSSQYVQFPRTVTPFSPRTQVNFQTVDPPPTGPTDFSNALQQLTWHHNRETKRVLLTWSAVKWVDYAVRRADHPHEVEDSSLLETFIEIGKDTSGPWDERSKFSVEVAYNASLEYKYRYLLACPTGLNAYWRYCTTRQTLTATVPLDLCEVLGFKTDEVHIMEAAHPKDWVKKFLGPSAQVDDINGKMVALPPKCAFGSTLEAEFYLKGAALFEKHAMEEKKNLLLDGHWDFEAIDASTTIPGIPPRKWVFLVKVLMPYSYSAADNLSLPEDRDPVTVIWRKEECEITHRWTGRVIASPTVASTSYNVAILVEQPVNSQGAYKLQEMEFCPYFRFDADYDGLKASFRFFDRLMFGNASLNIPTDNWVRNIILGRHNWAGKPCVPIDLDLSILAKMSAAMNPSQRKSYFDTLEQPFTQTIGPPGSGKSALLAALVLTLMMAGEKVMVAAQSNVAVREVLDKTLNLAEKVHAPPHIIASIIWNVADSGDGCDTGWDLLQTLREAKQQLLPNPTMYAYLKSSVHASMVGKEAHPNAIKNIIRAALGEYEWNDWAPTNDDEEWAILAHLQKMLVKLDDYEQNQASQSSNVTPIGGIILSSEVRPTLPVDLDDLKKSVIHAWEAAMLFYFSHKCNALFTTFGNIPSRLIRHFGGTALLADEICNTSSMNFIMACSRLLPTLKRVSTFGDPAQLPPHSKGGERNHLREQAILDPMSQLEHTGMTCVRLNIQYRMHPDISDIVLRNVYTKYKAANQTWTQLLFDDPSTFNRPEHAKCQKFVAAYLGKEEETSKVSVFVSVEDGKCLRSKNGPSKTNHQQIVAVLDILRAMEAAGINMDDVLIICFYTEAVRSMKAFLWRQGFSVAVEDMFVKTTDSCQGKEKLITVVVSVTSGCDGDPIGFLVDLNRVNVSLTRAQDLRVFVSHRRITLGIEWLNFSQPGSTRLLRDLSNTHERDGQMKIVNIGDRILEFEDVLQPERYILASDGSEARDMYDGLR